MEPLRDPVVEERYGRQVAAFKNAAGEPICDIAVIPYQCIPILVHLDPAAVNKTVPWPSVRDAHPLLTEMDRLGYHHWDSEPYRDFCRRLRLDPDCNRPIFEPSMAAVGEALVLRACTDHEEQTKLTRTFFGSCKTSILHKLVAFLRIGGDRSLAAYDRIQRTLADIRDDLASDPDRFLITRAMVEAGRLVVEPEPEPEPHGPVVLVIGDPGPFIEEADGFLSRLITNLVLAAAIRQDGRRVAQERILFVLDEFTRLGYMDKIVDVATIAAGAGIEALFVAQDRGSIEKVYGRDITDTLLASCATVRVFNLGRTDNRTAQWASEAAGFRTVATRTTTTRKGAGRRGASTSVAEHRDPLLTANQVQELPADQMLVFIRGRRPLKLKRIIAHTHKAYRDKLDPNPTVRS